MYNIPIGVGPGSKRGSTTSWTRTLEGEKKKERRLRDPRVLRRRLRWVVHTICRQEAPRAGVRTRASAVRKERSCSTVGTPDAKEICILAARRILERKMKKSDRSLISLVCVYVQSELEYRC